jgi:membrane protease YdiL (CAAX protease family)
MNTRPPIGRRARWRAEVPSLWNRIPLAVRAVLIGGAAAALGTLPWALLVSLNTKYWSTVPWAVPPTALYLWLYWRYLCGEGWPRSTAESRRSTCRWNRVSSEVWGHALLAGLIGLVSVLLLQGVLGRLVALPDQQDLDATKYPLVTMTFWVLMSAAVAGVTEEVAFRGYMQRPIERRHGPVVAVLVTGVLFGLAHFTHPEVTLALLPFYLAAAAVYGTLAYLTDSILPSVVLHAGGNVFSALDLFMRGRSEWQVSSTPAPVIWETGADASFWGSIVSFVMAAGAAVWAYARLAVIVREAKARGGASL